MFFQKLSVLVSAPDAYGLSPLHWACVQGSLPLAKVLVAFGGPSALCCTDRNCGASALHVAAWFGHHDLATWLQQAIMQPFDPRPKQLEFMKARSDMAATRQKPDPTLYLSPWGQEVRLSQQEVAEAIARAKDLEGEDKKPEWIESLPRHYPVGSTPRAQLW